MVILLLKLPVLFLISLICFNAKVMVYSFISVLWFSLLHPLHVSVTEIEHDEKDKTLEIMMRLFIDDTELTMRNHYKQPELDILKPTGGMTVDQMVSPYVDQHFKIFLDNKAQKVKFLGHEKDGDVFIFYLEVGNVKKWRTIQIQNDVFMDVHDDQSNLVHVTVKGAVKSMRLTKATPVDKLTFEAK
jgi:hypothetical protein